MPYLEVALLKDQLLIPTSTWEGKVRASNQHGIRNVLTVNTCRRIVMHQSFVSL